MAGPRLIEREAPQRSAAAGKKSRGERNDRGQRRSGWRRKRQGNRVAIRHENPQARGTGNAKPPFDGVVRGILNKEAQEAGARTKIGVRIAEVRAIETSLSGVGRIVPRVAEPSQAEL